MNIIATDAKGNLYRVKQHVKKGWRVYRKDRTLSSWKPCTVRGCTWHEGRGEAMDDFKEVISKKRLIVIRLDDDTLKEVAW